MDSLYRGCPDATILHPDYKIYGKDILHVADHDRLFSEMKLMLSSAKCVTQAHTVTNIVNIYEQIKVSGYELDHVEKSRIETCMRIKYPNRIRASPWLEDLSQHGEKPKKKWCVIS